LFKDKSEHFFGNLPIFISGIYPLTKCRYQMKQFIPAKLILMILLIHNGCQRREVDENIIFPAENLQTLIQIGDADPSLQKDFNIHVSGTDTVIFKEDTISVTGISTSNKKFLDKVLSPAINPHVDKLKGLKSWEVINELALFSYGMFRKYFGRDFYRWGGDILDLDDPQSEGIGHARAFGLDCSGFVSMPYELAVITGIISPESQEAVLSSGGFRNYCLREDFSDSGGRNNTSNNFRLDTHEMAVLGRELFSVEKDATPTNDQIKSLQPGDIAGRSGHFGIIVEISGMPYYLESGGWVLPKLGGNPVKADEALRIFAKTGKITVRRVLNDRI